ncbi:MAG: redoxin domain-containing protein [Methanoregula sp.]|jgi:peroxiredoxin
MPERYCSVGMRTLISDVCIQERTGGMMEQLPIVQPGDPARNFSLKDQDDKTFDLFEQSGKRVLLSFHPLAWTPFCAAQMQSLEENRDLLASLDTLAVGISVDSLPCKKAWAEHLGITHTPLLCDFWPHGSAARAYGIFRDANGFSERANIILDKNQRVVFVKIYPVHSVPDIGEIIAFLQAAKTV